MENTRILLGMFGAPIVAVGVLTAFSFPTYIPSELLAEAAVEPNGRSQMEHLLRRCRKGSHFRAEDFGVVYSSIRSWQNDKGWLATTHLNCTPSGSCSVRAEALIAAPRPSVRCGRFPTRDQFEQWLNPAGAAPRRS